MYTILKNIINHPFNKNRMVGAISDFVFWQIRSRLTDKPLVYGFTENSKLLVKRGMTGATGNIYSGLHEFSDMTFLLHFLRPQDTFIDIGANVGVYTVLASAQIGANSISFEPIPQTFNSLNDNIHLNKITDRVKVYNMALGAAKGTVSFTSDKDTMNHVALSNETNTISVDIDTLDVILNNEQPVLMKIDVEGFEQEVISGAEITLKKEGLKAIIIELNGSGTAYGYDEKNIHDTLVRNGFNPFVYDPQNKSLSTAEQWGTHNTIYIRDIDFVIQRINSSGQVKVKNRFV